MEANIDSIQYSWEGIRKMLHRLGLAWISPRSLHPKADLEGSGGVSSQLSGPGASQGWPKSCLDKAGILVSG